MCFYGLGTTGLGGKGGQCGVSGGWAVGVIYGKDGIGWRGHGSRRGQIGWERVSSYLLRDGIDALSNVNASLWRSTCNLQMGSQADNGCAPRGRLGWRR